MSAKHKATDKIVDRWYLDKRAAGLAMAGYPKPKWIIFCEHMLSQGYIVALYEARQTCSKYITVANGLKSFKVRFSNHAPILQREKNKDCDFFVGRTNLATTTTSQAVRATMDALGFADMPSVEEDMFEVVA